MKRYWCLLAGGFFALHAAAQTSRVDSILQDFYHRPDRVLVTAHRGAHLAWPENSLGAIREAIRENIDIAEIDVQQTKDSVLVLMHDKTVDRTTNGKGAVRDYTFAELRKLLLKHNGQLTTEHIPTFEEAMRAAKDSIMIDIDFKLEDESAAERTYEVLQRTGTERQALFFLYDYKQVAYCQHYDGVVPVMPRAYKAAEVEAIIDSWQVPVIHVDESFYSDSLMRKMRHSLARVWMNALGRFDDMEEKKADSGFDAMLATFPLVNDIQTNYPAALLAYLRRHGLHR